MENLVYSTAYENAVKTIVRKTGISIFPNYPEVLYSLDYKNIETAGLSSAMLAELLENDFEQVMEFSIKKLEKFDNVEIEQEYPPGEEPEEDEMDSKGVSKGYSKGFLILNLIEFYFLKKDPDGLIAYLKRSRIPKAEKYRSELSKIFDSV